MFFIKFRTITVYLMLLAFIFCLFIVYLIPASAVSADGGLNLPIIMYHSIQKDESKAGKYVITPQGFENDLKFLEENGYETVFMSDVVKYVKGEASLPEKPIVLTFDDGYYNNYTYAYPLLKKYHMKAVISIVGIYTDMYSQNEDNSAEYAHLNWDTVNEMMESGIIEFQNHSYNLHINDKNRNGSKKRSGESLTDYEKLLSYDLNLLQTEFLEHTGYVPNVYTYPFGAVSTDSFDIIKDLGFSASLSCENKTNYIKPGETEDLYMLNRFIRTSSNSVSSILKQ